MTKRTLLHHVGCSIAMAVALAGLIACGGPILHPEGPDFDEAGPPYGAIPVPSEESARRAATSCELRLASTPEVNPANATGATCPCTRRSGTPGGQPGCVEGADWGVTATVGPEGGDVLLLHTPFLEGLAFGVLLSVPPGALAEPTTIHIVETKTTPPGGYADGSPVYVFEPVGLTFATPASVKIPWFTSASGLTPPTMYWSSEADPCTLEPLDEGSVNAGFNQGTVTRLGWAATGFALPRLTPACP